MSVPTDSKTHSEVEEYQSALLIQANIRQKILGGIYTKYGLGLPTDHERLEAIEKAFIELVNEVI